MTVFLLWHMRPLGPDETNEERETDDKLCGVFSTEERAEAARQQLMTVEGFIDYPEHFLVDECEVDGVQWDTGFVSLRPNDD
ncbi:DUF7336 domain-containing protein [Blastococcus saxobsidens]|uniref:DUF7336 domain-containing protein n=1 Tax=Blastococcus saxobsidens (strain DD2) TaxID=1146883 RepID=H6RW23_BLASD|nr:hypothetical protein [Blastococcus saxobsidens]CCG02040.1 conserved protein of unknown function [Blastococcus saxobsidens DD2]